MFEWVNNLINKNGDSITLNEVVISGEFDTDLGEYPKTITPHDMIAVISNYRSSDIVPGVTDIDDTQAIIKTDLTPDKNWTVTYKGDEYNIINIARISTQNYIVTYTLQLRK